MAHQRNQIPPSHRFVLLFIPSQSYWYAFLLFIAVVPSCFCLLVHLQRGVGTLDMALHTPFIW